jgi:hypothetical protein
MLWTGSASDIASVVNRLIPAELVEKSTSGHRSPFVMQHPRTGLDDSTRYAYRRLLYWASLDLRRINNLVYTPVRLLNPLRWRSTLRQVRREAALADWLHNLALFSALEFDHFDEAWFWRVYDRYVPIYPEFMRYKELFDRDRSEYRSPEGAA